MPVASPDATTPIRDNPSQDSESDQFSSPELLALQDETEAEINPTNEPSGYDEGSNNEEASTTTTIEAPTPHEDLPSLREGPPEPDFEETQGGHKDEAQRIKRELTKEVQRLRTLLQEGTTRSPPTNEPELHETTPRGNETHRHPLRTPLDEHYDAPNPHRENPLQDDLRAEIAELRRSAQEGSRHGSIGKSSLPLGK